MGDTSTQAKMDTAINQRLSAISAANVPLIMGEIGDPTPSPGNDGGNGNNQRSARSIIKLAPTYGYGIQWWHLTGDSNTEITFSLMANKSQAPWSAALTGAGLSETGTMYWNLSKNKPNLGKFTGDYAASNCR